MARILMPADTNFVERTQQSFLSQDVMETLGASLLKVEAGVVEIGFGYDQKYTQQHGFIHAGVISTILDSACGYAAFSLMPADAGVLTVEFKINLLAPAKGERFVARARVKKPGRTITFAEGEMFALVRNEEKLIATMSGTLMTIVGRDDVVE